jgi:diacylglycerol kinase family enzyme
MYYYITEPLTTNAERKRIDDIKSTLSQLGIAGEFAVASPARTVAEHLELAFKKGFTTIVGVGSDGLANTVASTILRHHYEKAVFGFIPLDSRQHLWKMVGGNSIKESCAILRARHTQAIDAIELNADQSCITSASMHTPEPVQFQLAFREVQLAGQCTDLLINPSGEITIIDQTYRSGKGGGGFFSRLFGGGPSTGENLSTTSFNADRWQFATKTPMPIVIDGEQATTTPLDVIYRKKALKLIVNRARIATEKETDSSKE